MRSHPSNVPPAIHRGGHPTQCARLGSKPHRNNGQDVVVRHLRHDYSGGAGTLPSSIGARRVDHLTTDINPADDDVSLIVSGGKVSLIE